MRALLGIILILAGVALGIYLGLWLMFVGGIIAIVNAIQADPINGSTIAWGIVRIIFASFIGGISAMVLIIPGYKLIAD